MILLDTNVLIYAFEESSPYLEWSRTTIAASVAGAGAVVNPVILAELCVGEEHPETVPDRLQRWGIQTVDLPSVIAETCAGAYWKYLQRRQEQEGKQSLRVPLPDFFIGAHAKVMGWEIATVDLDRYRTYFPSVKLLTPPH